MRRRLPPLKQLVAFEAVARHRSFSHAAADLCLTNGAVSRQVKTLEDHLGVALFNRSPTGVDLTTAGHRLLPSVRVAFDRLELTTRDLLQDERQGALIVGCLPTLALCWMIPLLRRFRVDHPDIQVSIQTYAHPWKHLHGELDVAIDLGVADDTDECVSHKILDERHGPVCHPDLVASGKLQDINCLAELTLLHADSRIGSWDQWCRTLALDYVQVADGPRFAHAYLMLQAAAMGLGVGIAAQAWVSDDLDNKRLSAPFGFVPSGNQYRLYYLAERAGLPKIRAFCDWLLADSSLINGARRLRPEDRAPSLPALPASDLGSAVMTASPAH